MLRVACGWLDTVSTELPDLFSRQELAELPGALSLAARIKGRRPFSSFTVYVNVTTGALTSEELLALTTGVQDHDTLRGLIEETHITRDGKGLLFVSKPTVTHGPAFLRFVAAAFVLMQFVTNFTTDGGHQDFAKMR